MNKVFIFSIIPLNNAVSDANTVQMWVKQVEDTGEAVKEGQHRRRRSVRTPAICAASESNS